MAPTFLGVHFKETCPDCGIVVNHGAVQNNSPPSAIVCPNCGGSEFPPGSKIAQPEDLVKINSGSKSIDRWDVIAFKRPGTNAAVVKRVVGLPRESLVIADGNLWVNDAILKKPIDRQKEMRILVNDSRYHADRRWVPSMPNSDWESKSDGFSFRPIGVNSEMQWNEFQPRRCYAHSPDKNMNPPPIEDNYGYNQGLGRNLNPIDEVFVELELELSPHSIFGWRFAHRSAVYEFQLDRENNVLSVDGIPGLEKRLIDLEGRALKNRKLKIEFSTFDHHLFFQIDGKVIFDHSIPPQPGSVATSPIQFGATGGDVRVDRIRIWRDVYYLGPNGNSAPRYQLTAGKNGYLVLGDNTPISRDSRHWNPSEIEAEYILGRVTASKPSNY